MKKKILIGLCMFGLFTGCAFNLNAGLTLKDIGLTPNTEEEFLSSTKKVLSALNVLSVYRPNFVYVYYDDEAGNSTSQCRKVFQQTSDNANAYKQKLQKAAKKSWWLDVEYGSLPVFGTKFYEVIIDDMENEGMQENLDLSIENIEAQERIVDAYKNRYDSVIDNILNLRKIKNNL